MASGKQIYGSNCAMCHYDGTGSPTAPALVGSTVVNEDDPKPLLRVILKGQQNVTTINGGKFKGIMPPQAYLSDADASAVATYVRHHFAQKGQKVTAADAAAVRAAK